MIYPYCKRPHLTPIQNARQNYTSAYFNVYVSDSKHEDKKILDQVLTGIPRIQSVFNLFVHAALIRYCSFQAAKQTTSIKISSGVRGTISQGLPLNMSGSFHDVCGISETQTHDLESFTTPTRRFRSFSEKEVQQNYKTVNRNQRKQMSITRQIHRLTFNRPFFFGGG